jgi:hypothetical protein
MNKTPTFVKKSAAAAAFVIRMKSGFHLALMNQAYK